MDVGSVYSKLSLGDVPDEHMKGTTPLAIKPRSMTDASASTLVIDPAERIRFTADPILASPGMKRARSLMSSEETGLQSRTVSIMADTDTENIDSLPDDSDAVPDTILENEKYNPIHSREVWSKCNEAQLTLLSKSIEERNLEKALELLPTLGDEGKYTDPFVFYFAVCLIYHEENFDEAFKVASKISDPHLKIQLFQMLIPHYRVLRRMSAVGIIKELIASLTKSIPQPTPSS